MKKPKDEIENALRTQYGDKMKVVWADGTNGDLEALASDKYRGISYPPILAWQPFFWLWRKFACPRDWHLFDEVLSGAYAKGVSGHHLVCDACGLHVGISEILTEDESCQMIDEEYKK